MDQCDNCKFYRGRTYTLTGMPTQTIYECRYGDPQAQGHVGFWPSVLATDWCGKWVAIGATAGAANKDSPTGASGEVRHFGEIPL